MDDPGKGRFTSFSNVILNFTQTFLTQTYLLSKLWVYHIHKYVDSHTLYQLNILEQTKFNADDKLNVTQKIY